MSNEDCGARAPAPAGAVPAPTVDAGIATVVDAATGLVRFVRCTLCRVPVRGDRAFTCGEGPCGVLAALLMPGTPERAALLAR